MNDKEAREIRRRFKPDKTWINAVHGVYPCFIRLEPAAYLTRFFIVHYN